MGNWYAHAGSGIVSNIKHTYCVGRKYNGLTTRNEDL